MENYQVLNKFRVQILNFESIVSGEWDVFQNVLSENGFGIEETLKYLYFNQPSQSAFENWFSQNKRINNVLEETEIADVLNEDDLKFWDENGYVVIQNAIPREDCVHTQEAILEYLGASLDKPESWYQNHEAKEGLMVLFTQHPTLEKNRQSSKILKAYQQLYKTDKIYKTVDKVSFNPPENDFYTFRGSSLHWDVSLHLPIPFRLQGLLYLTDVKSNSGAFHCVAGFHHQIEGWMKGLPKNVNPRIVAVNELEAKPVTGNAGDFVIWHQALPHCATPNKDNTPRMVQYLTYLPINDNSQNEIWI
ncbi:MAG: phytanoyl-CoA dioxygenase family protein [Bacteroidota bacterium]